LLEQRLTELENRSVQAKTEVTPPADLSE